MFDLSEEEMSIGMGQHGEAGTDRLPMKSADDTTDLMLQMLLDDLVVEAGEELLVIINGAGSTTLMEQFIVFRRIHQVLNGRNIKIARSLIGEYITTQEQAGFQILIARMDRELLSLWDSPCDSPYFISP